MAIRVKIIFEDGAYRVDLPEYSMVVDSWEPVIPHVTTPNSVFPDIDPDDPRLSELTCLVETPNRLLNPATGRPDIDLIRAIYSGQGRWNTEDRILATEV